MPSESSFDIVSRIDAQELDNALNQARREIENRFDFKNSKTTIENDAKSITVVSDDEMKMRNVVDIIESKAVRRGIDIKAFGIGEIEPASGGTVRRVITLKTGIPKDTSRAITEKIKGMKLKVTTQIQDEQVRVTGKSRDDLQKVIAALKAANFDLPLQFVNYR